MRMQRMWKSAAKKQPAMGAVTCTLSSMLHSSPGFNWPRVVDTVSHAGAMLCSPGGTLNEYANGTYTPQCAGNMAGNGGSALQLGQHDSALAVRWSGILGDSRA